MKKKVFYRTAVPLIILLLTVLGCNSKTENPVHYKSDFSGIATRSWIGSEYWSNPLQDWQLSNGKLECLVSKRNRNVHLLTRQLDSLTGNLEMEVMVGFYNTSQPSNNKNWAGFSLGAKGEFSEMGDYTIFRKGITMGVTTNGILFIGNPSPHHKNEKVIKALATGVNLKVEIWPEGDTYMIDFSISNSGTGELLSNISKNHIANEKLTGDLVLVSNFQNEMNNQGNSIKSVWFKDWSIRGTKVTVDEGRHFGPILFSHYTINRNVLQLTAQMAPVKASDKKVLLQVKKDGEWKTIAVSGVDQDSNKAKFTIENLGDLLELPYRLAYDFKGVNNKTKLYYFNGTIRKNMDNPNGKANNKGDIDSAIYSSLE